MSGLLRRIKRSRAADTGGTPAAARVAGPDGAPAAETSAVDTARAKTTALPAGAGPIAFDPATPAGLDPAATGADVATGRRGRLRRRLRYLRRARELMLRDLGGLLYEVHRTGGGDVSAHTATIDAKVERLASLDAEAAAIETALGAVRAEAIVFEPGVGGTCDACGELYGSTARFCSHCGAPAGATVQVTPASSVEPRPVPAMPQPPASRAAGAREEREGGSGVASGEPRAGDASDAGGASEDVTVADRPPRDATAPDDEGATRPLQDATAAKRASP
jgi:hypothetical protein